MRVLHVISSISRQGGGPSRSSQGLVAAQRSIGIDAWLMTLREGEKPWIHGVDRFINGGCFDAALESVRPDIVHLHGIWQIPLHRCSVRCRQRKIPYVIAPRGMLEPWSLKAKWLKKRIARFLYQDRDLQHATALHATAESEAEQFRKLGFTNPVIVSPNGVNVPEKDIERADLSCTDKRRRRLLFVSRMHPKKGVLELVESLGRMDREGRFEVEFVYTLNGEAERKYETLVKARVRELGLEQNFVFTGPLDDEQKWQAYARADAFVLPTYSENFGIVVAEALWAGIPVLTTRGTPWQELETSQCGWWIDLPSRDGRNSWPELDEALGKVMALPSEQLIEMGQRGRQLVESEYSWSAAAKTVMRGYEQVMNVRFYDRLTLSS